MAWSKESEKDDLWEEAFCGGNTIWDDNTTFWDVSGSEIGTYWDLYLEACGSGWSGESSLVPGWSEESGV